MSQPTNPAHEKVLLCLYATLAAMDELAEGCPDEDCRCHVCKPDRYTKHLRGDVEAMQFTLGMFRDALECVLPVWDVQGGRVRLVVEAGGRKLMRDGAVKVTVEKDAAPQAPPARPAKARHYWRARD